LRDKFPEQGLNDIIGDYKGNYRFASAINNLLIDNLAKSDIIQVVVPLLTNWLKYRKSLKTPKVEEDKQSDNSSS